jgi:hypothetical protein
MTTQSNQEPADLTDNAGMAAQPATGETAPSPTAGTADPVGEEGREPTTAGGEGHGSTSATDDSSETASTADPAQSIAASSENQGPTASPSESNAAGAPQEQLVSREAAMDFKARWEAIQQGFVDDPRSAVSDADSLVSDVLHQLSSGFDEQHRQLEGQWSNGEPDTEGLRSALQRYRDFFDRLLTI